LAGICLVGGSPKEILQKRLRKKNNIKEWEDTALLAAMQADDEEAYRELYLRYYERLCRYIFSLSANRAQAEDIVQEVMLQFWKKRHKSQIHTSISAYLYQSVRNKYIDALKKNRHHNTYLAQLQLNAIVEIENEAATVRAERLAALHQAIAALPTKRKEVFILSKMQHLKYKEIAEQLDISERTVEAHIRKALIFLRERLLVYGPYLQMLIWYSMK